jgi:hypothetical protein
MIVNTHQAGHAKYSLIPHFRITTHRHRKCPYCRGSVYRERREGFLKLSVLVALRPYRCIACDKLHFGFPF